MNIVRQTVPDNVVMVVNGVSTGDFRDTAGPLFKNEGDLAIQGMGLENKDVKAVTDMRPSIKKPEKIIQIKNKYTEVIRLAEKGMGQVDIARMLNMGKGEVELILGLNRN